MIKKILIGVAVLIVLMQFIRPEKNLSDDRTFDISTKYEVPADVQNIMKVACNDCHTNKTRYPWYSNVNPTGLMLSKHVNDGKQHLNLSTFTRLPVAVQNHKFEEFVEMIEKEEMPLPSYTYFGLHDEANLTEDQRKLLMDWAKDQMSFLQSTYPADSLVMRRPSGPPPGD